MLGENSLKQHGEEGLSGSFDSAPERLAKNRCFRRWAQDDRHKKNLVIKDDGVNSNNREGRNGKTKLNTKY